MNLFSRSVESEVTRDDVIGKILTSKNYGKFTHIRGNRRINHTHVKNLIASHKTFGQLISPILVNEDYQVVDGQHRLEVWKKLGMPVYYFVQQGYGLQEMKQLNLNTKNWTLDSYMEGAIDQDMEQYVNYAGLKADYKFGHTLCLMVVNNRVSRIKEDTQAFKKWELNVDDWEAVYLRAEKLKSIKPFYKEYKLRNFASAVLGVFRVPGYNHERMLNKLRLHKGLIPERATISGYRIALDKIYNNGYAPAERLDLKWKDTQVRVKGPDGKFIEKK